MTCRRTAWTDLPDAEASCDGGPGALGVEEEVIKLMHSGLLPPGGEPFSSKDLFGPAPSTIDNFCYHKDGSHGVSLLRRRTISDDEVRRRAIKQAKQRSSNGGIVAGVKALRAIRSPKSAGQIVFVYDDPLEGEEEHCVLRVLSDLNGRTDRTLIRDRIKTAFDRQIIP